MAQTGQIDVKRLWEMVKKGMSANEIMKHLGISDKGKVKNALQEVMREKGEMFYVEGLIEDAALHANYTKDGIRISPEMLQESAFRPGDWFDLKVEGDKITLQKAKA